MVSLILLQGIVLAMAKIFISLYNLDTSEWDVIHFYSVPVNAIMVDIASLTCYQVLFFIYCVKCRFEVVAEWLKMSLREHKFREDLRFQELLFLLSQLDRVMRIANGISSKSVSFLEPSLDLK